MNFKSHDIKQSIIFGLNSYLPRTYTWVYNQLQNFKNTQVLILTKSLDSGRHFLPFQQPHTLFSFPGLEKLPTLSLLERIYRRFLRLILVDSKFYLLVFATKGKKHGSELIHAHFGYSGWEFIPISKILNIPLIVSFYGYDYEQLSNKKPKWKKRFKKLFKYGTLFLTEGEYGCNLLITKGVSTENVKVHHLGVDLDKIPFHIRKIEKGKIFKLVQVASFVEKKGHKILIETMKLLKNKDIIKNVSLTLIGSGHLKKNIINLIDTYHLKKHINFIEHIPYDSLHQELLKYHCFISPSVTTSDGDIEGGAPVVFLDAQASGMPVISTFHCDIPEEIIHKETGLLVQEGDTIALANAIEKFLDNPELLIQYGTAGRKHVEKNYSAKIQAKKLEMIYSNLLSK